MGRRGLKRSLKNPRRENAGSKISGEKATIKTQLQRRREKGKRAQAGKGRQEKVEREKREKGEKGAKGENRRGRMVH